MILVELLAEIVGESVVGALVRPHDKRQVSTSTVVTAWVVGLSATAGGWFLMTRPEKGAWATAGFVGVLLGIPIALVVTAFRRRRAKHSEAGPPGSHPSADR